MKTTISNLIPLLLLIIVFKGIILSNKANASPERPLTVIVHQHNLLCYEDNTGLINLEINGGVAPYSFKWNTGARTKDLSGLAAGVYTAQVKDARGSVTYVSATINQPAKINIDALVVEGNDGKKNGHIQLNVTGGTGKYDYLWSDNSSKSYLNDLEEGIYAVKVSDKNQCFETALFRVKEILKLYVKADVYDLLCNNDETGLIDITVKGGRQPYSFKWSNGSTYEDLTGLNEGRYSVTITDADGQTIEKHFRVNQPEPLMVMAAVTDEHYKNAGNGSAVLEVSGGKLPYSVRWEDGSNGFFANNLSSGTYSVIVTDAHLCTITHQILISETSSIVLNRHKGEPVATKSILLNPNPASDFIKVSSPDQKITSITLYDSNGKAIKSISDFTNQVTLNLKDLKAGIYIIVVVKEAGTEIQKIAKTN